MEPSSAREDEGRGTDKWEEEEDITAKRLHVEDEEQELEGLDREHVPVPRFLEDTNLLYAGGRCASCSQQGDYTSCTQQST
jgi:hypothetical protein